MMGLDVELQDPYVHVLERLGKLASQALSELDIHLEESEVIQLLEEPPKEVMGDIALPVFQIAKKVKTSPAELARALVEKLGETPDPIVEKAVNVGGYVNFYLKTRVLAEMLSEALKKYGEDYGRIKVEKPLKIVVEHTSANPVHPLHIGHARNSIIGDTLSRLLTWRGHRVERRFYVNDMGRQVAILIYGYRALGCPKVRDKPDHFMGIIYAMTNTIIEIDRLKTEINDAKKSNDDKRLKRLLKELDEWVSVADELRRKGPELFDTLVEKLRGRDHEKELSLLMKAYEERSDKQLVEVFRKVSEMVIEGFKETLRKVHVEFDYWDWESNIVWSSILDEIVEKARKLGKLVTYKGAYAIDLTSIQRSEDLRRKLGLPQFFKIPPLIVKRSDGTTLYPIRDVAYSIVKFRNADKVINVIMAEQKLEQLQVKLALYALGYIKEALNLIHYSYEIVKLPGVKMSGRRGRYVSFDSVIDDAIVRAFYEVKKRNPNMSEEEASKIAKMVGIGAIRYALISVSAEKPLLFDWNTVLSFEQNSGPYIQYTYARARNILKKYGKPVDYTNLDYDSVEEKAERRKLVKHLLKYPHVISKAADTLAPETIVDYAGKLSETFNKFYDTDPVLTEKCESKKKMKLVLVKGTQVALKNILSMLGIEAPEKM